MKYKNIILLVSLTFSLFACTSGEEKKEEQDNQSKDAFLDKVQTIQAELSCQSQELTLAGKVECDPEKIINYTPLINGVIDCTYFSLGDKVQKGQNMLDIRSTELSALHSEKISLETDHKIAEQYRACMTMVCYPSVNFLKLKEN